MLPCCIVMKMRWLQYTRFDQEVLLCLGRYPALQLCSVIRHSLVWVWKFPKIRGTLFWGPDNKDPTI